jgi:hypothetical protein
MTLTWEVTAVDAGTRVDIRADDVPDGISAEDHATGTRLFADEARRPPRVAPPLISKGAAWLGMWDSATLFGCW